MENYINIEFENGETSKCEVLCTFAVEEIEYIALLPEDGEEVYLYRYVETEDGMSFENIESDEEYEKVVEVFETILDEEDGCGCGCGCEEDGCDCGCEEDEEEKGCGCGCGCGDNK